MAVYGLTLWPDLSPRHVPKADGKGAEGTVVADPAAALSRRGCVLQGFRESGRAAGRDVLELLISASEAKAKKSATFSRGRSPI